MADEMNLTESSTENSTQKKSIKKPSGWNTFFQTVAKDVLEELGPDSNTSSIGQASSVAGRMWKSLPKDRRMDWSKKAQTIRENLDTGIPLQENTCPICDKVFNRAKDCKYHIKGCKECACDVCGLTFKHTAKLDRHQKKEHLGTFNCTVCNKTFAEKRNLKRHQSIHSNKN
ncbi:gastrula zinc finger protein XlCGF29.1-like [Exaiptasia diaphana]|uniref:C2H2-type domain-containing protein n=1 Tax=Exaiptasia diaphana TaxID=2652724 RepID=A0A913X0Y9_EXADI|nr:gastrula zinc finger protein XlCGF29.1-like [Exaiptasia diaphana]